MTTDLYFIFALFAVALVLGIVLNALRDRLRVGKPRAISPSSMSISMVVPARDAASTIVPLLQDLHAQDLDKERIAFWVRQFAELLEMPELWTDVERLLDNAPS